MCRSYQTRSMSSSIADRKSTRLNSSHLVISYAVFCLKKKRVAMPCGHRLPSHFLRRRSATIARQHSAAPAHFPATRNVAAPESRGARSVFLSIRFARTPAARNVAPAPECRPLVRAEEAESTEKHKSCEINPGGKHSDVRVLPDFDASLQLHEHPRARACLRRRVRLRLLPARATISLASSEAYRRSHRGIMFRRAPAQIFRCAALKLP